jgi:HK97 family phage portal protein
MSVPVKKSAAYGQMGSMLQEYSNATSGTPRPSVRGLLDQYADNSWVYACIQLIQTKGAGVPLKVYRTSSAGKQEEVKNHALQRLLETVNPLMNGYDLLEATHGYIELCGMSYWLPDKEVRGLPTELIPLIPSLIEPKWNEKGLTHYEYRINGKLIATYKPEELIAFRKWDPLNPFIGLSSGVPSRDVARMILSSDRYNAAFIENGATAGGFLTTEKTLLDPIKKLILEAWNKLHRGSKNVNKVGLLDGGLKWEGTSVTHNDMQFTELQKMSIRSLLAAYRVQPVMLGIHDDSNYSNANEQRRAFWVDSMIPRLRKIESVINEKLAPRFGDDIYVAHDLSGVEDLQEDQKVKAERDQIHVQSGIKTINEVRAEMNLPPVAWGYTWNAPFGLTPIDAPREPLAPAGEVIDEEEDDEEKDPAADAEDKKTAQPTAEEKGFLRRTALWHQFKGRTENMERVWFPSLRSLFKGQEREVLSNLRTNWQKSVVDCRLGQFKTIKQDISVILFERGEARRLFQKEGRRLIEKTLVSQAEHEQQIYNLPQFQVLNPKTVAWIQNKAFRFAQAVNETTEEALRTGLEEAIKAGESIAQVEKRIESIFEIARGSRTKMIARTEVISASNQGAMVAYQESGVVKGVEWISSRDALVRDEHRIDGAVVDLGQKFSNGLQFPGDPAGEASNVINCRCTTAPVVHKE